ncbi:TatD family hydrolase [Salinisphaera sp.]|uniref:TatD family hydrolase n=1 Tax=Salinisphaera sp. TaxID=1914330 RepID=UPI002D778625|nr:TatD family hydrolase [Salinisphaera sp.]HET7315097.1 TatD family hydrolase [Salinisphaera sp.]
MALIDIGANLAHDSFDDDRDAVLRRAQQAGVAQLVITGSDLASSRAAIDIADAYTGRCFATAGLHPHHARDWGDELAAVMGTSAAGGGIVAIGETGLDYFRDISPRDVQRRVFAAQLGVAAEHDMPVFLHQRDAHADFIAILREHLPHLSRAVVHCFTDGRDPLADYLAEDLYIGITGWICDERRGGALREAAADIPDDRLMIETDCPYLLPRTIRPKPKSRRNEPAYLPWVRDRLAAARDTAPAHIEAITTANARRFFNL